jgi:hypothetical protein
LYANTQLARSAIHHHGGVRRICFGFGYLTAFIMTRNKWRDEMIERRIARLRLAHRQMGMGRAADI